MTLKEAPLGSVLQIRHSLWVKLTHWFSHTPFYTGRCEVYGKYFYRVQEDGDGIPWIRGYDGEWCSPLIDAKSKHWKVVVYGTR